MAYCGSEKARSGTGKETNLKTSLRMKKFLSTLLIFLALSTVSQGQSAFAWSDSLPGIGQLRTIRFTMAYDGPCTLTPCASEGNNRFTYDTLVSFLKQKPNLYVALIWHTGTLGGSEYNLKKSRIWVQKLVNELERLGIKPDRLSGIGVGEMGALIPYEEIQRLQTETDQRKADLKNERVEVVILAYAGD